MTSANQARAGVVVTILVTSLAGCGPKKDGFKGSGNPDTLTAVANDATIGTPFDAAPDATGERVFLTAVSETGPAIWTVPAAGGSATQVSADPAFVTPVAIAVSEDGKRLYVADPGAEGTAETDDLGLLFEVSATGGAPSAVAGTAGKRPRNVTVAGETVWFTGVDDDGQPALFRVSGGTAQVVAKGAPLGDPQGLAVTRSQDAVYVLDAAADDAGLGRAIRVDVATGASTVLAEELRTGYPAGAALSNDESALLLSTFTADGTGDAVLRIELGSGAQTFMTDGIASFSEPAGLHRAAKAEVYAWCDSRANTHGTVYVLTDSTIK